MSQQSRLRRLLAEQLKNQLQTETPGTGSLSEIWEVEPPTLTDFVAGSFYMAQAPSYLSDPQYQFIRHFEQVLYVPTYIDMVEEFGEYWSPVRMVNELTAQLGKGCLVAGEVVYDARTGRWVPVEELAAGVVASVDGSLGVTTSAASASFVRGRGECFEVTTRLGAKTRVYGAHQFLTPEGWRQLRGLQPGSKVASVTRLPLLNPVPLPQHEVELVAACLGSGMGRVLADRPRRLHPRGRSKSPLLEVAERYGVGGSEAHEKRVPSAFFSLPDSQVGVFLARLWEMDGYVGPRRVEYSSFSERLVRDVAMLLRRLGIRGVVRERRSTWTRKGERQVKTGWVVRVSGREHLLRFCERVVLLDKRAAQEEVARFYLNSAPRGLKVAQEGDIAWDEIVGVTPIGVHDYYDLSVPGPENYVGTGGLVSHNSGKDYICQLSFARVANILLSLRSPLEYFGLPHQAIISLLNVATSGPQAHSVFFKPLRHLVARSPFFEDKFEGDPPSPAAKEIKFVKGVELVSGHSSIDSLEGKNLLAAIADEVAAFPTSSEVLERKSGRESPRTADAIVGMLRSSAMTRFPGTYKVGQISFPRFKGDAIQQATATALEDIRVNGDNSVYFNIGPMRSWDVNPRLMNLPRVRVPGASEPVPNVPAIVSAYKKNPREARGRYECEPELAPNRYFRNDVALTAAFGGEPPEVQPVEVSYRLGVEQGGDADGAVTWQADFRINIEPKPGALYAVHGDMAVSNDRAGIAMSHVVSWEEREIRPEEEFDEDGNLVPAAEEVGDPGGDGYGPPLERRPVVQVDFATYFAADLAAMTPDGESLPREIQVRWFRKLIFALLAKGFPIRLATFDQFQSVDTRQILKARGVESTRVSLDANTVVWQSVRDVMYDNRLRAYPIPLALAEFQGLTRLRNGKVDHLSGGSKDVADAIGGSVAGALVLGGQEDVAEELPVLLPLRDPSVRAWNAGRVAPKPMLGVEDLETFGLSASNTRSGWPKWQ